MHAKDIKAILKDIDQNSEGDSVELWLKLKDGTEYHGAVTLMTGAPGIVVLSITDQPPLYLDIDSILAVTLWSGAP